ncbi:MAG: SsrA-binding protein SmpB [Patescibacteria group bacterium]|nr:SsrA-binding protein SmpB [Patescibacteria group bacterium]
MKSYAENKKGYFNYEILDEFEAGLVLSGGEVKSIRDGKISIRESFATIKNGEIWLTNAHINPYEPAKENDYEPTRPRKLLLSRGEIDKIIGKLTNDGYTLIPLKIYDKKGKIKALIGLVRGKKKHDKREIIKKRDRKRDLAKDLKEKSTKNP